MADSWRVILEQDAIKTLKRLPRDLRERISRSIDDLATDPRPPGVTRLRGHQDLYRRRVGDWRIIYSIYDDRLVVLVIEFAARGSAYKDR